MKLSHDIKQCLSENNLAQSLRIFSLLPFFLFVLFWCISKWGDSELVGWIVLLGIFVMPIIILFFLLGGLLFAIGVWVSRAENPTKKIPHAYFVMGWGALTIMLVIALVVLFIVASMQDGKIVTLILSALLLISGIGFSSSHRKLNQSALGAFSLFSGYFIIFHFFSLLAISIPLLIVLAFFIGVNRQKKDLDQSVPKTEAAFLAKEEIHQKLLHVVITIETISLLLAIMTGIFTYDRDGAMIELFCQKSPDENHKLCIYKGGTDFPFGATTVRVKFSGGSVNHEIDFQTQIDNDGKGVKKENFDVVWREKSLKLTLMGEEQNDVVYIFPFEED